MVVVGTLKSLEKHMDIYPSCLEAIIEICKPEVKEIKSFARKQEI